MSEGRREGSREPRLPPKSNANEIEIVLERAHLADEFQVCAEIHGVLALDPGQTITEFGNRNVAGLRRGIEIRVGNIWIEGDKVRKCG